MIDEQTLYSIVDKAKKYDDLVFIHKKGKLVSCSFCGKSQNEVKKMVAGVNVYICNECVELCTEIVDDGNKEEESTAFKM